ncbi:MAG: hypothetical protein JJ953_11790 [Gracilimonas sp.]|uniref:hypothetical protein n=1 Tax=Gracilimonas sp. TaxID=1974203 RepID=UPI001B2791B2|nr:hypothetical protein [Gracilimonas sp.]MBO6586780.1 hypothetical protein [Gracilimonas sp.]MBO6615437.1 hypothetical protein [Gracilimonas sp.]
MNDYQTCRKCGGRIVIRKMDGVATPIHIDGACGELTTYEKKQQISRIENNLSFESNGKKPSSFTIPNANCPVCGDNVFYYENEHGSKVYFDELGPPWPKHPCTSNGDESSMGYKDRSGKGKWYKFELEDLIKTPIEGGYEYEWMGRILDGKNQFSYLMSVSDKKLDGLIHKSCYIKKTDPGTYLLSFIQSSKDYTFEDAVLYSTSLFDNKRQEFIERHKRREEQKAKEKEDSSEKEEEVKIRCKRCRKLFYSMKTYNQHFENRCIDKRAKKIRTNPPEIKTKPNIDESNTVKHNGEFLCFHCQKRFSSKEKYHNHSCK